MLATTPVNFVKKEPFRLDMFISIIQSLLVNVQPPILERIAPAKRHPTNVI